MTTMMAALAGMLALARADTEAKLAPLLDHYLSQQQDALDSKSVAAAFASIPSLSLDESTMQALESMQKDHFVPLMSEWTHVATQEVRGGGCDAGQVLTALTGRAGEIAITWQSYNLLDSGSAHVAVGSSIINASVRSYDVNTTQWLRWAPHTYFAVAPGLASDSDV